MKQTFSRPQTQSPRFEDQVEAVCRRVGRAPAPARAEGLRGASRGLFLAQLRKRLARPIVVLTADPNTAETLLGDLKYFFRHLKLKINPQFFPPWELLPYEKLSPLPEVSGERLMILNQLREGGCPFLVVPLEGALQCVVPRSVLENLVYPVGKGDSLDREILETCLSDNGYTRSPLVEDRGEYSVRGDIIDFYPPGFANPVRIQLFGDEVESIRPFDLNSQVSLEEWNQVTILPVRELCLTEAQMEAGGDNILAYGRTHDTDRQQMKELLDRIQQLRNFSGLESLAPFFYSERETLFHYLSEDTLVVVDEEELIETKGEQFRNLVQEEYQAARERGEVVPEPGQFYLDPDEVQTRLSRYPRLVMNTLKLSENGSQNAVLFDVRANPPFRGQFEPFAEQVLEWEEQGKRVALVAPTKGQVRRVHELMDEYGVTLDVDLGYISSGFQMEGFDRVFVAEHEIFGRTHKHRYRRKPKSQSFQRGFKDLKPGDYLVHIEYGIGQYQGTRELQTGVGGGEFLEILYADDEKLYIPMDGLGFIQKYLGSGDAAPPLSKLGGVAWKRQKSRAQAAIREMAEDLLKLYAARELAPGSAYRPNPVVVQEFADSFDYEETEDQLKAIDETLEDLERDKPMDRLICGDVGYGKTEVAMRAAMQVVWEKKQVALLVPTTILAQQHLTTFRERFRNYPIQIDGITRFRSPREQKQMLEKLKRGELDIIIGTHRLLSRDVQFADLGLIIIDEEQRFGVRHKEALKKLRTTVDILTLSATPIPRTLHFSLMGVRDLSVIETPPSDRLSVKTFVRKFDEKIIREAILRELDRGGQIFFVHNKVKSIASMQEMIQALVPEVRVGIAHGQLPEHQLEKVMKKFIDKEIDLLLCTSIIESGLDIPSANTIVINRADQFGLAQLYQLRGRVGRYRHQAYAYLLIPGTLVIPEEARKRLIAIEEMSELGSGFQLAARDMEIRGVGNMLGHKQSGHISAIGFDLYCQMIEETVRELRGEKVESRIEPEIDLMVRGTIPKDYIPDLNQRLEVYRRLQLITDFPEKDELSRELADRYGPLPEPVEKLLMLLGVRIHCQKLHISRIKVKGGDAVLTFEPTTPIPPPKLAALGEPGIQFLSEYQLAVRLDRKDWRRDIKRIQGFLSKLQEIGNEN